MATSSVDLVQLTQTGSLIKSAVTDPLGRDGLKEQIFDRLVSEVEGVMSGPGVLMDGAEGIAAEHEIADIRILARTADATFVFRGAEAFRLLNKASPFLFATDLGLPTDGTTDCTDLLNAAFAGGPVTVLVDVPAGLSVDGKVALRSGCALGMGAASTLRVGANGRVLAEGYWAEEYDGAPLRLLADVAADGTAATVDTAPQGGGLVTEFLEVGDRIVFREGPDRHEAVVTVATDPSTLEWTPACPFALTVAGAGLTRQKVLPLSADFAGDSRVIPVESATLGRVSLADYVLVMDDATADGGSAFINVETAQVVGIEVDGVGTISVDRPIRRAMTTAQNARVQVLAPVVGARVTGGRIEFKEDPGAERVDTFEILYGVDCVFENLRISNEDSFGSRGQMFRVARSYRCGFRDCVGSRPRFTASGEGVGFSCVESVQCFAVGMALDGCRHSIAFQASTDCWAELVQSSRPVQAHVDFSGRLEIGCWARGFWASGGTSLVTFGDATKTAGSRDCFVEDVVSLRPLGAHVDFIGSVDRCGVRRFTFVGGTEAFKGTDHPLDGALTASDCFLADGSVQATSSYPINIDGGFFDSAARAVVRPRVSNVELVGHDRHFRLFRCVAPLVDECEVRNPATLADLFVVRAQDAAGITVRRSDFTGVERGFNLTNCANGRIYRNSYVDWTGTQEYADGGGNTGLKGADNVSLGFTKTGLLPS